MSPRSISFYIFLWLFSSVLSPLFAQEHVLEFERISLEHGLSQNSITSIIQDRRGLMWFGTLDGLNKFDGYDFTVYKHSPADSNSLSANSIWSLCEDTRGVIWIATVAQGLNRFDPKTGRFARFYHHVNDSASLSDNRVRAIFEDRDGNLWIGTRDGGLNRFDRKTETFVRYTHDPQNPNSVSDNHIRCIMQASNGMLWIGTGRGGINQFDPATSHFIHYKHDPDSPRSLSHNHVESIYQDRQGVIWVGTYGGGLDKLDLSTKENSDGDADGEVSFRHYQHVPNDPATLSDNTIEAIFEDHTGTLWVGTASGGLNKFERQSERFYRYLNDLNDQASISHNNIETIYEDRTNNLWIGTWGGGINKIDRKPQKFLHYKHKPFNENSLSHNYVRAVHEDASGALWIGTSEGGLDRLDRQSGEVSHYKNDPDDPATLSSNDVRAIWEDRSGTAWVGTYGGGLNKMNSQSEAFIHYKHDPRNPNSLGNNYVWTIYEDATGILWLGTSGGLDKFDPTTGIFKHYKADSKKTNSLSHNIVRCIYEDRSGVLWVGTYGGFNKFDPQSETFVHYRHHPAYSNSLSNNSVMTVYQDSAGIFWLGTLGGGLNRFDPRTERFEHYTENDGLPNSFVHAILEDNSGCMWLSTNKGIAKFDPRQAPGQQFRNYDVTDGLQSNEFNVGAAFKNDRGELFFGGINGLTIFDPEKMKDNPNIPSVVLTGFRIFNWEAKFDTSIFYIKEIELSYKERFFSFEFAALDFTNPMKNQYAYMLEGFDSDWIHCGNRRFASYTNLDPGVYVFHVKGSNNDGVWNETGASVAIRISPPFWDTWWFKGLMTVFIIGALALIYNNRVQTLKKEKIAQQKFSKQLIEVQEKERKRIASELHDSLGQNLLIIKNLIYQQIHSDPGRQKTVGDLEQISSLASQSINEVREISYNLHPHQIDRLGLTKAIESIVNKVSQSSEIEFLAEIDNIDRLFPKAVEINIYRIIQEGINNLVKHSDATSAVIKVSRADGFLIISIRDDGRGFDARSPRIDRAENQGFGLTGISERVKMLDGRFNVDSAPGRGTTLKVEIPIPKQINPDG